MSQTPRNRRQPAKPKEPKHDWFEKTTLGAAIVGVVVITLTYVANCRMTRAVEGQLEEMRAQTAGDRPFLSARVERLTIPAVGSREPKPQLELLIKNTGRKAAVLEGTLVSLHFVGAPDGVPSLSQSQMSVVHEACLNKDLAGYPAIASGSDYRLVCDRFSPFTADETNSIRTFNGAVYVLVKGFYSTPERTAIYPLVVVALYDLQGGGDFLSLRRPDELHPDEEYSQSGKK
jgi:hypothetical protein